MKSGFRGAPRPLLPAMLLVASTNPNAGQEHDVVPQTQPSSSTLPVQSSSLVQSPPPIPTPTPTPTPIPASIPTPFEHTFKEPSPVHQHFSPPQEQAQGQMTMNDLLQVVPQLISRITAYKRNLKQTKLTMGKCYSETRRKVKNEIRQILLYETGYSFYNKSRMLQEEQVEKTKKKETKGKKVVSSLVFQEEVDTGAEEIHTAEGVNTGSIKLSTVSEQVNTGSEQEASLAEAIRLDSLQKEEEAKQIHLDSLLAQRIAEEELNKQQKKRKAQVQFEAQHYTDED
ncbi:hypothetical protein Tco_0772988 [Tanacetum coccineum]|uniref:Uncharacterized protein n=1 Tax=Tanacetum coccineum TaxID=301880 RepID=A0ABQ4ZMF0_9ASTR